MLLSNCFLIISYSKLLTFFVSWTFLICTNVLFSTHTPHAALRPIVLLFCQHVIVNNTRAKNFCKQSSPFHSGRWLESCQRGLVYFVKKRMSYYCNLFATAFYRLSRAHPIFYCFLPPCFFQPSS